MIAAAVERLHAEGLEVVAVAPLIDSAPIGPARRRFANGALIVASDLPPRALLALLKRIEADFGRRRGRRWGDRVLDLDLLLWSGGAWHDDRLTIPHPEMGARRFVLDPLGAIIGHWPDPATRRHVRQLATRAQTAQ